MYCKQVWRWKNELKQLKASLEKDIRFKEAIESGNQVRIDAVVEEMKNDLDVNIKNWTEHRNKLDEMIKVTEAAYLQVLDKTQNLLKKSMMKIERELSEDIEGMDMSGQLKQSKSGWVVEE